VASNAGESPNRATGEPVCSSFGAARPTKTANFYLKKDKNHLQDVTLFLNDFFLNA